MKRILLYGATGRTGSLVLKYAMEKGYEVTALVRNPDKINEKSAKLKIVKGSPANFDDVKMAMQGCDAVISTLAGLSESDIITFKKVIPTHLMKTAMQNTVKSMSLAGIKKVAVLTSLGVGDSYAIAPWFMKLGIKLTNLKISFADHNAQESVLMKSGLDWIIVRPVGLNDNEELKNLAISYNSKPEKFSISRKQVARFLVDALENNDFVHKTPVISEFD